MKKYRSLEAIPSKKGHKHDFVEVHNPRITGTSFYKCQKEHCYFQSYYCFHEDRYIRGTPEEKPSKINGRRLYCRSCNNEIGTHHIDEDDFNRNTD